MLRTRFFPVWRASGLSLALLLAACTGGEPARPPPRITSTPPYTCGIVSIRMLRALSLPGFDLPLRAQRRIFARYIEVPGFYTCTVSTINTWIWVVEEATRRPVLPPFDHAGEPLTSLPRTVADGGYRELIHPNGSAVSMVIWLDHPHRHSLIVEVGIFPKTEEPDPRRLPRRTVIGLARAFRQRCMAVRWCRTARPPPTR